MPETVQLRVLMALESEHAIGTLRGYFHARGDVNAVHARLEDAAEKACAFQPHLILLELKEDARALGTLCRALPGIPVVAVAPPAACLAFEAAKQGATDFLPLPLESSADRPHSAIDEQALKRIFGSLTPANPRVALAPGNTLPSSSNLFNASPRMREIRNTIEKVAATTATVLIRGESGVGKEIVARLIFARSDRSNKPFIKVNCAAIPNDLLESELFGYEAGAFTGAQRAKPGKFELADGGTLFLDEIGEMHPALQAKLLHVLQDGQFARLGAKRDTTVNVRVLCATNKLLEQRVADGLFREDLLYRINVVTLHIPPLRERSAEIDGLIRYFIQKYSAVYNRQVLDFPQEAMQSLTQYAWPGNIRELENLCKRYVIVADATQIVRELSQHSMQVSAQETGERPGESVSLAASTEDPPLLEIGRRAAWAAERQAIREMLAATRWNRRETARRLHVSYKALLNKVKQMEMEDATRLTGTI